jgi:endoglucanase
MMNSVQKATGLLAAGVFCTLSSFAAGIVAVDQAGYRTKDVKAAYLSVATDSFHVVDAVSRSVIYRGIPALVTSLDASTGMQIWKAEFTGLQNPGTYFVRTAAGDTSEHFAIADSVYNAVLQKSLKGFYFQRCGTALEPAVAGPWQHPPCHVSTDGYFHATAESTGFAAVAGGWHDAGDYGKYVVNAGITVGTLLMAYEWFPAKFSSDNMQIPESGNGIPDILDEARYELEWLLKMQAASGGVFHKVTKAQFEGFVMPDKDTGNRYIYQISSTATGDFVAMLARAARVFRPFDSTFADTCLAAAERGWQFLVAHPTIVPTGGFHNPTGTVTGEYGDSDDSDERLWAAAELYLTTGDTLLHSFYLGNYASRGLITSTMGWAGVRTLAHCTYLRGTRLGISAGIQGQLRQSLLSYATSLLSRRGASGFRNALSPSEYWWGSNSQVLNNGMLLILAGEEGAGQSHLDAALDQLHYVLGVNAYGFSFVTGIGARHVLHPHHRPSGSDGVFEPVPGLIAGGPNKNITNDPVLQAHFTTSTPPALCYVDDQGSYASNEICINWNAPLVFVAGYFSGTGGITHVKTNGDLRGYELQLEQNYPNPFNGTTTITFFLSRQDVVNFSVYDVLGRRINSETLGEIPAGEHHVRWSARDQYGRPLSSGVYFYCVAGTVGSLMRKLILLN